MAQRFSRGWEQQWPRKRGKPMGSLSYSEGRDDGEVTFSEAFDDADPIAQLDMIQDWIGLLNREYKVIFAELYGSDEEEELV